MLVDVNVLLYAHRHDLPQHPRCRSWLDSVVNGNSAFGMSSVVLSGFLRVVTHPKIFDPPTPLEEAIAFANMLSTHPHCVRFEPGPRHWQIFIDLCRAVGARGNLVPDAWLAALAIESGSEWITTDGDYARFAGLRWRNPLQTESQKR